MIPRNRPVIGRKQHLAQVDTTLVVRKWEICLSEARKRPSVPRTTHAGHDWARDGTRAAPNETMNQPDFPPRVFFNELAADSLNIRFFYWDHSAEYRDFLEHAHRANVQIIERCSAEGIDSPFRRRRSTWPATTSEPRLRSISEGRPMRRRPETARYWSRCLVPATGRCRGHRIPPRTPARRRPLRSPAALT